MCLGLAARGLGSRVDVLASGSFPKVSYKLGALLKSACLYDPLKITSTKMALERTPTSPRAKGWWLEVSGPLGKTIPLLDKEISKYRGTFGARQQGYVKSRESASNDCLAFRCHVTAILLLAVTTLQGS